MDHLLVTVILSLDMFWCGHLGLWHPSGWQEVVVSSIFSNSLSTFFESGVGNQ
jgi:hypothetical protein